MNPCEQSSRFFVTVFLASVLATLCFWAILPSHHLINESVDYESFYAPVARNILTGHGIVAQDGTPATRYPPGYPLILAGIFGLSNFLSLPEEIVLRVFTLVCMGLTSIFVFSLTRSMWGPSPALISAFVWMTHPFALWLTKQPNSEIPFMPVLYGGFYLFLQTLLRNRCSGLPLFLCGLLVGVAMLIRPAALGVGVLLGAMLWIVRRDWTVRRRLVLLTMLLLGNLIVVLPWEVWLYLHTDRIVLLGTVGQHSVSRGLTFAAFPEMYSQMVHQDVAALLQDLEARSDEMNSLGGVISILVDEFQRRPLSVAKLLALKMARSWYGTDSGRFELLLILIQVPYLILVLWSSYRVWKQGGTMKQWVVGIWLIVFYFWGMSTLGISMLRYMVPAIGLLIILIPGQFPFLTRMQTLKEG